MDASPIRDELKAAGADLVETDGVEAALSFEGVEVEHRAVRESAGVVDCHPLGVGVVSGPDRRSFLHDVMTNATEGLDDQVLETAYMTAEGEIVGYFHLAMLADESLVLHRGGLDRLVDEMQMMLMISDVDLEPVDRGAIAVQGPDAGDVLDALDLPSPRQGWVETTGETTVLGIDSTGSGGAWIVADPETLASLWEAATDAGATPVGQAAAEAIRIEAKIPAWGREVTGDDLPQECGIEHAVDFEKGCYPGQEAVAKLENLGTPRKHLESLVLSGPVPPHGAPVTSDGQLIGEISSAATSPGVGGVVALALLKRGEGEPGTPVEAGDAEGEVVASPIWDG